MSGRRSTSTRTDHHDHTHDNDNDNETAPFWGGPPNSEALLLPSTRIDAFEFESTYDQDIMFDYVVAKLQKSNIIQRIDDNNRPYVEALARDFIARYARRFPLPRPPESIRRLMKSASRDAYSRAWDNPEWVWRSDDMDLVPETHWLFVHNVYTFAMRCRQYVFNNLPDSDARVWAVGRALYTLLGDETVWNHHVLLMLENAAFIVFKALQVSPSEDAQPGFTVQSAIREPAYTFFFNATGDWGANPRLLSKEVAQTAFDEEPAPSLQYRAYLFGLMLDIREIVDSIKHRMLERNPTLSNPSYLYKGPLADLFIYTYNPEYGRNPEREYHHKQRMIAKERSLSAAAISASTRNSTSNHRPSTT